MRRFSQTTPWSKGWPQSTPPCRSPASSFGELQETETDREILREIGMSRKKDYARWFSGIFIELSKLGGHDMSATTA
jgi:hypothetical protein